MIPLRNAAHLRAAGLGAAGIQLKFFRFNNPIRNMIEVDE
jgi:hypothetical protein